MKLTVPANYDASILPTLKSYGTAEIYGKLPFDITGGGRPSAMSTSLSKAGLARYIAQVHAHGMEFNYLMNSACFGNEEWTPKFHRELDKLLTWVADQKVETLTIAAPFLVQVVKKRFPQFKIKAGIYAQIDTVSRAKYWEDLGCDTLNLESFSINRDFEKLRLIRASVKADLVLIANHFCQPNCPYQIQHQNGHAHASGLNPKFYIDYPLMQCNKNRLTHKHLFIAAGWIRPEDIHRYEAIGYTTFKLLERNIPSDALVARAKAYHERKYEGNLADLILSWGFKAKAPNASLWHTFKAFRGWKMPLGMAGSAYKFMQSQGMLIATQDQHPVQIDTSKIPADFLDHFDSAVLGSAVPGAGTCADKDCAKCGYCHRIARDAVKIDPKFLETVPPVYNDLEGALVSGTFRT